MSKNKNLPFIQSYQNHDGTGKKFKPGSLLTSGE